MLLKFDSDFQKATSEDVHPTEFNLNKCFYCMLESSHRDSSHKRDYVTYCFLIGSNTAR